MVTKKFLTTTTNDMGDKTQQESLQDWDRIAPVGREFGSPDYESAYFGECDRSFRRIVTGGLSGDFSSVSVT